MINHVLKKFFFFASLLLYGLTSIGYAELSHVSVNSKELQAFREKNLQADLKYIQHNRNTEIETSTVSGTPVIDNFENLDDIVAYALKHNLDVAVMKLERDIQMEALTGAKLKMLPSLTLGGEFSRRNNYNASYSDPLDSDGGSGFQDYNYSSDKKTLIADIELSWDLLDFGIACFQQKQASDKINIAEQRRRRAIQNLKLDVTEAYWQLQVAKTATQMAAQLITSLQKREKILQNQLDSQTINEINILETSTALTEMKLRMIGFEQEQQKYMIQLATHMGKTKPTAFQVAEFDFSMQPGKIVLDIPAFETAALRNRPELFEKDLEENISTNETRINIAKMFPSTSVFGNYNYDHDSHIHNDTWHNVGLRISMDLLSIPSSRSRHRAAKIKTAKIRKNRLSIAGAILAQMNLAIVDYKDSVRKYRHKKQISSRRDQLMQAYRRHAELGKGNIEDVLRSESKFLFSKINMLSSYADVMIAKERILNTIGRNHLPSEGNVQ